MWLSQQDALTRKDPPLRGRAEDAGGFGEDVGRGGEAAGINEPCFPTDLQDQTRAQESAEMMMSNSASEIRSFNP